MSQAAAAIVAIVDAGATGVHIANSLLAADISDFVILDREVDSAVFDDDTDTWTLTTTGGQTYRSRVVIAAHDRTYVPWIPNLAGCNDFRGQSVHSTAWDPAFDPTGKRIAVVGGDAAAGQLIDRLVTGAASVQIFPLPPRRIVPVLADRRARAKRRVLRGLRAVTGDRREPSAEPVKSPIDVVTATGIRTCDGADHDVDAIVYGTGFAIAQPPAAETLVGARGVTLRQAWQDGTEPYAGIAVHGFPNYFWITRPKHDGQLRYIVECLRLFDRTGSTRIEVRRSYQQVFNERVQVGQPAHHPAMAAFELSSGSEEHTYDGAATLTIADTRRQVHVRLTGYIDPLDGKYHWQGAIFDSLPDVIRRTRQVTLTVGERSASARITEQTAQGAHSIAGVGAPPFMLESAELASPPRH